MTISTKFLRVLPGYGAMALAVSLNLIANDVQALSLTGTSGAFSNPIGGGFINYPSSNEIRWGENVGYGQSGLRFNGVGAINPVAIGTEFRIGTLLHFNNTIGLLSTASSGVDLGITLGIDGIGNTTFNFTMLIDETRNFPRYGERCPYGDSEPCADAITWANAFAAQSFSDEDFVYTLELIGFGPGGNKTRFISDEAATNGADLYARILAVEIPTAVVPTPVAILPGLIGMFGAALRKKSSTETVE